MTVFGLAGSALLFDEELSMNKLTASGLVLAGVLVSARGDALLQWLRRRPGTRLR